MGFLSGVAARGRNAAVLPYVRGDVLEVGCAWGDLYERAGGQIRSYAGIDYDAARVDEARRRHPDAEFAVANVDDGVPQFARRFDAIVMVAVAEHLFNLKTVFGGLAAQLKPGGRIVATTPTVWGNDVVHRLASRLGAFNAAIHDDHIVIFNARRFRALALEIGLEVERHALFQLGCNQLAVLRRPDLSRSGSPLNTSL